MIVCLCRGITDRKIAELVAGGATNSLDIAKACGAGIECGSCVPLINRLLEVKQDASACPTEDEGISNPSVLTLVRA